MNSPTTGWPAPELAQDDCYPLFAWFASKPDALRLAREAAARIAQQQQAERLCAPIAELGLMPWWHY
jgi:hypothetical protein